VVGEHAVAVVSVNEVDGADAVAVRIMERQTLLIVGMKLSHNRSYVAGALDGQSLAVAVADRIAVEEKRIADEPFNNGTLDLGTPGNCD
jgi:hypothetical protein